MRGQPNDQLVFVFMCSNSDANGVADFTHQTISDATGLPTHEVRAVILRLESEDPSSRSPEARGARIVRLDEHRDWGWLIINYDKYRNMNDIEKMREQAKLRVRKYRQKLRESSRTSRDVTLRNVTVTHGNAQLPQAVSSKQEAEEEAERNVGGMQASLGLRSSVNSERTVASRAPFLRPSLKEVADYCLERRNSVDPQSWMDHYESNGWRVGRNPMKSWKAAVRTWERSTVGNGAPPGRPEPPRGGGDYSALEKAQRDRLEWEKEHAK